MYISNTVDFNSALSASYSFAGVSKKKQNEDEINSKFKKYS